MKIVNPLYEIARRYALELDISKIVIVEQAVRFYKSLHSKEQWLDAFHKECMSACEQTEELLENLADIEFFDSILTAFVWERLETQIGAAKSSFQLAQDQIQMLMPQIEKGVCRGIKESDPDLGCEQFLSQYPEAAWLKLQQAVKHLQYPWLEFKENVLLLLMVAFHKWYWKRDSLAISA